MSNMFKEDTQLFKKKQMIMMGNVYSSYKV